MNAVLLLHGALGAESQLQMLKSKLETAGRTVHTLNFSGHGGQPFSSEFGIEIFADEVLQYLHQQGTTPFDVFGYSMGGYVAVWAACQKPNLFGKIMTLGTKFDWSPESADREIKKMNPEKVEEKIPAFARLLSQRHQPNDWKMLMKKTALMMDQLGRSPLLLDHHFKNCPCEVVVALGDQDDMADRTYSEAVAGLLPKGTFTLLKETPHPIERTNLDLLMTFW